MVGPGDPGGLFQSQQFCELPIRFQVTVDHRRDKGVLHNMVAYARQQILPPASSFSLQQWQVELVWGLPNSWQSSYDTQQRDSGSITYKRHGRQVPRPSERYSNKHGNGRSWIAQAAPELVAQLNKRQAAAKQSRSSKYQGRARRWMPSCWEGRQHRAVICAWLFRDSEPRSLL